MQLLTSGISAKFVIRNEKQGKHLHCSLSRYLTRPIISEDKAAYLEDRDGKKQPHSPQ